MKKQEACFGSIDVETGETCKGYIDKNGVMKYKRPSWWRRLFIKPLKETKCIGYGTGSSRYIWSSNERTFQVPIYKDFNPITGKIYRIWARVDRDLYQFSVEVFISNGILAELS